MNPLTRRLLPLLASAALVLLMAPAPVQADHGDPPGPLINCTPDCPTLGDGCPDTPVVDFALCFAGDVLSYDPVGWTVGTAVWYTFYVACHVVWSGLCNLT